MAKRGETHRCDREASVGKVGSGNRDGHHRGAESHHEFSGAWNRPAGFHQPARKPAAKNIADASEHKRYPGISGHIVETEAMLIAQEFEAPENDEVDHRVREEPRDD